MKTRLDYDIVTSADDEPIVLSGPPGRLTGVIPVNNCGDDRAVVRSARFNGGVLSGEIAARVPTTVLRPARAANLRTRLRLDPTTPPGDYECEVDIAGSTRHAVLRVVEQIRVVAEPAFLLIENTPGRSVHKQLLVTNRGNVPITVGHPGGIALDDERGECRVTRATYEALGRELAERADRVVRAKGDEPPAVPELTLERAFGEWVRQGRDHLADMGVLGVRVRGGPVAVEPGEQALIDLTFRVPSGLDQHTRYIGSYPLYDTDLAFVIVPGATAHRDGDDGDHDDVGGDGGHGDDTATRSPGAVRGAATTAGTSAKPTTPSRKRTKPPTASATTGTATKRATPSATVGKAAAKRSTSTRTNASNKEVDR